MNIRDSLNSITPDTAARTAMRIVDAIQDLPPAEQVAGASFLFFALARRFRQDSREALLASERRFVDALDSQLNHRPGDATRALANYIQGELK